LDGADHAEPFQVSALPAESTATQNEALAHETEVSLYKSMLLAADQDEPFQVSVLPLASTTAQNEGPEQETEVGLPAGGSTLVGDDQLTCVDANASMGTRPTRTSVTIITTTRPMNPNQQGRSGRTKGHSSHRGIHTVRVGVLPQVRKVSSQRVGTH
jgi:hypothetical protein